MSDLSNWYLDTSKLYVARVREELDARWKAFPIDLTRREIHEVIGGLLARQCSLAIGFAENTGLWNPNLAGPLLRAMADVHITLGWILLKPEERARQYVLYGLGQEKLLLEHLISRGVDDESTKAMEAWIDSQRYTWLTEVNVGSWSESSIRDMAEEAALLDFYRLRYQPLSTQAHSMWNHVARANLQRCTNPLHRYHSVPIARDFSPDFHAWDAAAAFAANTFTVVDAALGLKIEVESSALLLDRSLEEFARARAGEDGAPKQDDDASSPSETSESGDQDK